MRDQTRAAQGERDTFLEERRARWTDRGGRRWEDVEPVYRVGWDVSQQHGRDYGWSDVEPHFRKAWTERHPDKPWDRFLDAAKDVWDDMTAAPGREPHAGPTTPDRR